jgi:prophage antirepressor-like protein
MLAEIIRQEEFEGMQLAVIEHRGEEWFTAEDIGKALGFMGDEAKAIRKIYERNADEFEGLSVHVKLTCTDGKRYTHRLFNAQAAVKFGFFAKTIRAKAFRHWASQFLTKGVKQLRALHEKTERRIRRLEKKDAEWETYLEVMKGDSHQVSHALMCEIAQLEKQLHQGVSASLLQPEDVVAVPWAALQRLAALAGDQEENYSTRLLHAVLACQAKYDRGGEFIKANLGAVTISFDMKHLVQEIEGQAKQYLKG